MTNGTLIGIDIEGGQAGEREIMARYDVGGVIVRRWVGTKSTAHKARKAARKFWERGQ